jgi:tetratricopeptide (TPR) repeat protein
MLPVPVLTPRLSSLWLGLVTPLFARVGRTLIESICHETVVRDTRALRDFAVAPMGARQAIERALANEDREFAQTRWSDALSSAGSEGLSGSYGGVRHARRLFDSRRCTLAVTPTQAFEPIRRIGGKTGWYAFDALWQLRGFIDLLCGGVGMRRGRRDPEQLRVGDTVDWWRVEAYEEGHLLRLRAEMKLPGRAWLEFEVKPAEHGSLIHQTAVFDPSGLSGLLYWYAIYPLHALVFRGLLAGLAGAARRSAERRPVAALAQVAALLLLLLCAFGVRADASELGRADALWARRAEGHVNAVARPEPVRAAIAAYERAIAAEPRSLEAYGKLLRAFWFSADFASANKAEERSTYEQADAVAERAFALLAERVGGRQQLDELTPEALAARLPEADRHDAAEIYFWHAVNLGAWSRIAGLLQAVRAGVAGRIHEATLRSIALDPAVEQGGAIRLLSRLHSELPRVPLLSSWVDHAQAVPLAERALKEYPQHPGNAYLLGLALLSNAPERRADAMTLIEGTATLEPRSDQVIEDLAIRIDARELIEKEQSGAL